MYKYFMVLTLSLQGLFASNLNLSESDRQETIQTYQRYFLTLDKTKREAVKQALYPAQQPEEMVFLNSLHISEYTQDRELKESVTPHVIPTNYNISTLTFLNVEFQSQVRMVFEVDYGHFRNKFTVLKNGQGIPATYRQLRIANSLPSGLQLDEYHPFHVAAVFHEWVIQNQALNAINFQFGNRSLPFTLNFKGCKGNLIFNDTPKGLNYDFSESPGLILYYEN